ncbi:MAG: DNA primase [Anaerolineales bacterium]|nr:DNA primase [Anaerolineales bacterium]
MDLVDIVSETVSLRKSGRNFAGFCPFHSNTRTPAFYVFPETQTWRCFGACAEGGDLFSYVMKRDGLDFKEALTQMARRAGVELEPLKQRDKHEVAAEQKLADLLAAAADYFHMLLLHAPEAAAARRYVDGRKLTPETLDTFRLGFALDSWDACRNHFNEQGYTDADLLAAGLLTENEERGTRYDRFRNRLMIPIRDLDGRIVGFGARTLDPDGIPKYLNSPQTPLFDKSSLIYGLDGAKRHIREARQVVIVEGYMDVMQGWQHGYRNLVAQMGTALTEQQLRQLKRYTKRFVLALDADAAGAKATLRGLQVARETLDHEVETRFDARGLLQHEARLQADIHVVTLPAGQDPDSIIRAEPARWPQLLAQAKPVAGYVIDVLTADLDLGDPKAKTAVAQQIIPLINDIADPIVRDHYWQQLARALQTDERALRRVQLPDPPRRAAAGAPARPAAAKAGKAGKAAKEAPYLREANVLRHCLLAPRLVPQIDQRLTELDQPPLGERDFALLEDKLLWQRVLAPPADGPVVDEADLWDSLDDPVLLRRVQVLQQTPQAPRSSLDRLPDTLALSVLQWRRDEVNRRFQDIRQLVGEAARQADGEALQMYQAQVAQLVQATREIDRAIASMSAVSRRRAEENGRL